MSCSSASRLDFYSSRGWRVVKKESSWKTLAGLAVAALAFLRLSVELPTYAAPPGKACGLTYNEIQAKLNQIEIDWQKGLYTLDEYSRRKVAMQKCLRELMEAA